MGILHFCLDLYTVCSRLQQTKHNWYLVSAFTKKKIEPHIHHYMVCVRARCSEVCQSCPRLSHTGSVCIFHLCQEEWKCKTCIGEIECAKGLAVIYFLISLVQKAKPMLSELTNTIFKNVALLAYLIKLYLNVENIFRLCCSCLGMMKLFTKKVVASSRISGVYRIIAKMYLQNWIHQAWTILLFMPPLLYQVVWGTSMGFLH